MSEQIATGLEARVAPKPDAPKSLDGDRLIDVTDGGPLPKPVPGTLNDLMPILKSATDAALSLQRGVDAIESGARAVRERELAEAAKKLGGSAMKKVQGDVQRAADRAARKYREEQVSTLELERRVRDLGDTERVLAATLARHGDPRSLAQRFGRGSRERSDLAAAIGTSNIGIAELTALAREAAEDNNRLLAAVVISAGARLPKKVRAAGPDLDALSEGMFGADARAWRDAVAPALAEVRHARARSVAAMVGRGLSPQEKISHGIEARKANTTT